MKLKQILAIVLSVALVACISVAATVAYLTSTTKQVTNTFTVGDIEITLDENTVDENGKLITTSPDVTHENEYHLYPGSEYDKNPTVHITDKNSENSWIFVAVKNEILAIEDDTKIADQIVTTNKWTKLYDLDDGEFTVYYKEYDKTSTDKNLEVFSTFKIKQDVDNKTLADYQGKQILVKAYAIQKTNLTTADAAWEALGMSTSTGSADIFTTSGTAGGDDSGDAQG